MKFLLRTVTIQWFEHSLANIAQARYATNCRIYEQLISDMFLSRVSTLTRILARDIDIAILSVRLSVRYVPVSDENGLTYCHSFFHHSVAESFLFYQQQTSSQNSDGDGVTPPAGR